MGKIIRLYVTIFSFLMLFSCKNEETKKEIKPRDSTFETLTKEDEKLKEKLPDSITVDNHSWIMDAILGAPKKDIKNIGILVYDGVNDLDFMNPRYVFGQVGATTRLIAVNPGTFKTVMGIEVKPDTTIDEVEQLDMLIIPGGFEGTIEAAYDDKILNWIKKVDRTTTYTASVCTGAWILGATGLLEGKKATTNWFEAEKMLRKYGATFVNERYTNDGKYWTSAGVTAGLDMSLAILNDNWGKNYTQGMMLDLEYAPEPPIVGGTPEDTNWKVRWLMNEMYKAGVNPIIKRLEKEKKKQE